MIFCVFFFNDTATTEIYTLSLHDALPIYLLVGIMQDREVVLRDRPRLGVAPLAPRMLVQGFPQEGIFAVDRKSTRLNSSHLVISYAVFCLKKKQHTQPRHPDPLHLSAVQP